jgi:hypothetical protein
MIFGQDRYKTLRGICIPRKLITAVKLPRFKDKATAISRFLPSFLLQASENLGQHRFKSNLIALKAANSRCKAPKKYTRFKAAGCNLQVLVVLIVLENIE